MNRFYMLLTIAAFLIFGCVTAKKDEIVANSLGDLDERPMWTVDGKFQTYLVEELGDKDKKEYIYKVGSYSSKNRRDLDVCYRFARSKVETEIRNTIGQALSSVIEEAVDSGDITTGDSSRAQTMTTVVASKGALAGLSVHEKFWQQIQGATEDGNMYECYVLARMPVKVYKTQLKRSIAKMNGISQETKEKLKKRSEEADQIIKKTFQELD